jgi:hypothetical protein
MAGRAAELGVEVVLADQLRGRRVEAEAAQPLIDRRVQLVHAYLGHAATVPLAPG